jgi:hypothetical protein
MRLTVIAAMLAACAAQRHPNGTSVRGAMRMAESRIIGALVACGRLPDPPPRRIAYERGARLIRDGPDGDGTERLEIELRCDGREFYTRAERKGGAAWSIVGGIVPDPCTNDTLAVTQADVDELNAQGLPWKATLTPAMIGKTARDFGFTFDPALAAEAARKHRHAGGRPPRRALEAVVVGGVALPESYDATDRYAGEYPCKAFAARDQGACGACSYFATTSVFNARLCMNQGRTSATNILMSPRQISDCVKGVGSEGCGPNGGSDTTTNAQWYTASPPRGVEEWSLPYQTRVGSCGTAAAPLSRTFAVEEGVRTIRGAPAMQAELLRNGPMAVSFVVHNSLFAYGGAGVYVQPPNVSARDIVGGHDSMLVGWGTDGGLDYWKVQNSWGAGWGDRGMLRIRRGTDECSIETRGITTFTPLRAAECPESPCANGSITLADCSCQCVGPLLGGPLCDTVVNPCQNGGQASPWRTSCLCPTNTSGPLCQDGSAIDTTPIVAALAAEAALLAVMKTRLDTAAGPRAQLLAQSGVTTMTWNGRPFNGSDVWFGVKGTLCFSVPPWQNQAKANKEFRLYYPGGLTYFPDVFKYRTSTNFTANPAALSPSTACLSATFPIGINFDQPRYYLALEGTDGTVYVNTPVFRPQYLVLDLTKFTPNARLGYMDLTLAWNFRAGVERRPGDYVRVAGTKGPNAVTQALLDGTSGTSTLRLPMLPATTPRTPTHGPYRLHMHRAGSPTPFLTKPAFLPDTFWANNRF